MREDEVTESHKAERTMKYNREYRATSGGDVTGGSKVRSRVMLLKHVGAQLVTEGGLCRHMMFITTTARD